MLGLRACTTSSWPTSSNRFVYLKGVLPLVLVWVCIKMMLNVMSSTSPPASSLDCDRYRPSRPAWWPVSCHSRTVTAGRCPSRPTAPFPGSPTPRADRLDPGEAVAPDAPGPHRPTPPLHPRPHRSLTPAGTGPAHNSTGRTVTEPAQLPSAAVSPEARITGAGRPLALLGLLKHALDC